MDKKFWIKKLIIILGLTWMTLVITTESVEIASEGEQQAPSIMANPAAVYCEEQGGSLENVTFEAGERGYCVFEDRAF